MSLKTIRFHKAAGILVTSVFALTACDDFDGVKSISDLGKKIDPIPGSQVKQTSNRPKPDSRGVITYPNYKVIVARRGDKMGDLASRVGISADEFATYNGLSKDYRPRAGELFALPKSARSAPKPVAPTVSEEPARPASDPLAIAEETLDDVPAAAPAAPTGPEPDRHVVKTGETAYTIARKYGVSVTSLASWNGLDKNLSVRTGQQLLIPVEKAVKVAAVTPAAVATKPSSPSVSPKARPANVQTPVSKPGNGSATPLPPSSTKPTPAPVPKAEAPKVETPKAPTAVPEERKPTTSSRKLLKPVNAPILRDFSSKPGGNEGIDFGAPTGTAVKAAENGTVALTSNSVDGTSIILIRHPNNLYTVYSNVSGLTVKKGTKVSRGQTIGKVAEGDPSYVHFEVRKGTEAVNPAPYLN